MTRGYHLRIHWVGLLNVEYAQDYRDIDPSPVEFLLIFARHLGELLQDYPKERVSSTAVG